MPALARHLAGHVDDRVGQLQELQHHQGNFEFRGRSRTRLVGGAALSLMKPVLQARTVSSVRPWEPVEVQLPTQ